MAFVSSFVSGSSVRGSTALHRGKVARGRTAERASTVRAVISLPKVEEGTWTKVTEPLYPLQSDDELQSVLESSFVESAVVVTVLNHGDSTSDVVEDMMGHIAHEFVNLSFYSIDVENTNRFNGRRLPRVVVYAQGEAVEDKHVRLTTARQIRPMLKPYADGIAQQK